MLHEAAVIGVDDRDFGKRLRAFVVPGPDSHRDPEEIKQYCVKDNLARYRVPREVVFLDELPRNATGKRLAQEPRGNRDRLADAAGSRRRRGDERSRCGSPPRQTRE